MNIELPDPPASAAGLTPEQARLELAVSLFQQERLTLGLASQMAGLGIADMMEELCRRRIPLHYDAADLDEDMASLKRTGVL